MIKKTETKQPTDVFSLQEQEIKFRNHEQNMQIIRSLAELLHVESYYNPYGPNTYSNRLGLNEQETTDIKYKLIEYVNKL
jgi:hypothetical protein